VFSVRVPETFNASTPPLEPFHAEAVNVELKVAVV
jgi:hypothetical protein